MSEPIPVFVNDQCVRVPAGSGVAVAVASFDPGLAKQLETGTAYVTDGRGIRLVDDSPLTAGAILRVIVSSRRQKDEADAEP